MHSKPWAKILEMHPALRLVFAVIFIILGFTVPSRARVFFWVLGALVAGSTLIRTDRVDR